MWFWQSFLETHRVYLVTSWTILSHLISSLFKLHYIIHFFVLILSKMDYFLRNWIIPNALSGKHWSRHPKQRSFWMNMSWNSLHTLNPGHFSYRLDSYKTRMVCKVCRIGEGLRIVKKKKTEQNKTKKLEPSIVFILWGTVK